MGERGHVLHVQGSGGSKLLGRAPVPCAWLGAGKRWTSFVPVCNEEVDDVVFAASLGAAVAHVWFDDDAGITVQITVQSGFLGELSVALGKGEPRVSDQDARFVDALVERKILTKTTAKSLLARLGSKRQERDAWIAGHGLEELFGFPHVAPIPPGADQTLLEDIAPDASLVTPAEARAVLAPTPVSERKPSHEWSPEERVVVDLHVYYWTHVWSMNTWTLYNRYKKHLPANARRDVDQLGNAVGVGDDANIRELVEQILARVWAAEDWGALIRSAKVDDCGTDEDVAQTWLQMTGRA